jgi:hypothetical protein
LTHPLPPLPDQAPRPRSIDACLRAPIATCPTPPFRALHPSGTRRVLTELAAACSAARERMVRKRDAELAQGGFRLDPIRTSSARSEQISSSNVAFFRRDHKVTTTSEPAMTSWVPITLLRRPAATGARRQRRIGQQSFGFEDDILRPHAARAQSPGDPWFDARSCEINTCPQCYPRCPRRARGAVRIP